MKNKILKSVFNKVVFKRSISLIDSFMTKIIDREIVKLYYSIINFREVNISTKTITWNEKYHFLFSFATFYFFLQN